MPSKPRMTANAFSVLASVEDAPFGDQLTATRAPFPPELSAQVPFENCAIDNNDAGRGAMKTNQAVRSDVSASTSFLGALLVNVLSYIATALLFSLMSLGCADVVGRYFLGKPVTGGLEVTELLLAAMIFVGLPLVSIQRGHVGLEILDAIAPPWLARVLHWFSHILTGAALTYLSWMLLQRAENLYSAGETTAVLQLPLYPVAYLMSACVGLAALVTFAIAWQPASQHAPKETEND